MERPSGTVTMLFTDIEGSTRLLHELGAAYEVALSDHRRILRESATGSSGVEVDTQGDAFFFAFQRASDAVAAAALAQAALAGQEWQDGAVLRVRMGIHTGEPTTTGEGYVGVDIIAPPASALRDTAGRSCSPSRRVTCSPTGTRSATWGSTAWT